MSRVGSRVKKTVGIIKPEAMRYEDDILERVTDEGLVVSDQRYVPWDLSVIELLPPSNPRFHRYPRDFFTRQCTHAYANRGYAGSYCSPFIAEGTGGAIGKLERLGGDIRREFGLDEKHESVAAIGDHVLDIQLDGFHAARSPREVRELEKALFVSRVDRERPSNPAPLRPRKIC